MGKGLVPGDPQQVGEFWLARRLGEGGQGVVYEAYDEAGARIAIKVLHRNLCGDGDVRDRFAKEVVAAQRVSSFCTARVLTADLDAPRPYIVSEYVDGPSLKQAVERSGLIREHALHRLAVGISTALTAIHQAGVVHRDLKPHNVLLGPDGPRVIDFGIARTEEMTRSATGQVKGTPRYMAPEIFRGQRAGQPSDVWAWGAVVVFAATGRDPFDGDLLPTVMHQVLSHHPDLTVLPEPLRSLVAAALAKDPAQRPTARDLLLELVGRREGTDSMLAKGSRDAEGTFLDLLQDAGEPSLAEAAENVYQDFDSNERTAVPRILLRMVMPGEGAADTLRRVCTRELLDGEIEHETVEGVLDGFTKVGVLDRTEDTVRIVNAALLRAWPRMREWVDAEREGLGVHHALAEAARLWDDHGRKPSDLFQGTPLERVLHWAATGRRNLSVNLIQQTFIDASLAQVRARIRRRQVLTITLVVLLMIALIAIGVAVKSANDANHQRNDAISRQLAAQSETIGDSNPTVSQLLSVAAWRAAPTSEARESMLTALARPGRAVLSSHGMGGVRAIVFSPDGKTLTTTSDDRTVRQWDVATRRQIGSPVALHADHPGFETFSPNGAMMAAVTRNTVLLWEIGKHGQLGSLHVPHTKSLLNIAFSPDGSTLATVDTNADLTARNGERTMRLWDVATHRQISSPLIGHKDNLRSVTFAPDGETLAIAGTNTTVLWDMATRRQIGPLHTSHPLFPDDMTFSPNGKTLATVGSDHTVRLWDTRTRRQTGSPLTRNADDSTSMTFSPDGETLATAGFDRTVRLWNVATRQQIAPPLAGHTSDVTSMTFSPDGKTLATASMDGSIRLWDMAKYLETRTVPTGIAVFSPDGKTLAIGRHNGTVWLWDMTRHRHIGSITTGNAGAISAVGFNPDGKTLATREFGGSMKLWDVVTRRQIDAIPGAPTGVNSVVGFTPDGKTLATTATPATVQLWNIKGRYPIGAPIAGHAYGIYAIAFNPNGSILATASYDGTVRLWDVGSHRQIGSSLTGHSGRVTSVAFSPDGKTLATAGYDGTARLWNVTTHRPTSPPFIGDPNDYMAATFSPDGRTLATVGGGTVRLWDAATHRQVGSPLPTDQQFEDINAISFSPDGRTLAVAGSGLLHRWQVATSNLPSNVCVTAGRSLTREENDLYNMDEHFEQICP